MAQTAAVGMVIGGQDAGASLDTGRDRRRMQISPFGADATSVSSALGFNFAGAWFATPAGAGDKAGWINISAYDALNQLIGSSGNVAIGDSYLWVAGGFSNVALLTITRDTGWYVMDDFTTTVAAAVPVPATPLVLGIGLLALGLGRRRRLPGRATARR